MTTWDELRNKHDEETCLIIGNGPSLKDIPLGFLKSYPSLGSNRIYLLDGFTPDYYACVNPLVLKQYANEIAAMQSVKFIRHDMIELVPDALPMRSISMRTFSRNPNNFVYEGYTVTFVLLQLAFYMGFSRALLVGVDHRYTFDGKPNQPCEAIGKDTNHFHEGYFTDGKMWNNPDLKASEMAYILARYSWDCAGREIINITPGTALDVFQKEDWQKWQK